MNKHAIKYQISVGKKVSNLYYVDNNLWLTLNNISELFNTNINRVYSSLHSILKRVKLSQNQCNRYIDIPLSNGLTSKGSVYSLEIAIAIGYKIDPKRAMELHKRSFEFFSAKKSVASRENRGFLNRLFL